MSKVVRRSPIHAPVDEVFKYLDDKRHFPEFWQANIKATLEH